MFKLISECNDLLKNCGFSYVICGGWALELFMNKKIRPHSDIDISIFNEDRKKIVEFMLGKGWNVFEHKRDWIDNKIANNYLRAITNINDDQLLQAFDLWAIKPDCSFIEIEPHPDNTNKFDCEITNDEQLNFDYIGIIFNKQENGYFICDKDKNISRELDKAILYNNGIPYLAPEIILFIISDPAYLKSEYHKEKNQTDFKCVMPFLSKNSKYWLINALEIKYPEGNIRLEQLKAL